MDNRTLTAQELIDEVDAERAKQEYLNGKTILPDKPEGWAGRYVRQVRFNRETAVIEFIDQNDRWMYEIDLEQAKTSEEVLHWVFHLAGKGWAFPPVIGAVVHLLRNLLWEIADEEAEDIYCRGAKCGFDWTAWLREDQKNNQNKGI